MIGPAASTAKSPRDDQAPSALLRHSTRLRLALAERIHAIDSGLTPPAWIGELLSSSQEEDEARLTEAIAFEARSAVVRLKRLMRHEAFPEVHSDQIDVVFDRDEFGFSARVSGSPGTGALIEISLGLLRAIDNAILSAACKGGFFANAQPDTSTLDEPIPYLTFGARNSINFDDQGTPPKPQQNAQLVHAIPRVSWRLLQCDLLAELALQWIVLHEYAHWALGHLGLANKRSGNPGGALALDEVGHTFLAEGDGVPLTGLTSPEHRAIELQADYLACELLFFYHRAQDDDPVSALARFAAAIPQVVDVRGTVIGTMDETAANRILGVASGIIVMVMEAQRRVRVQSNSATHPMPEARALQMLSLQFALANSERIQWRQEKKVIQTTADDEIAEIESTLRHQFNPFVVDMWAVSETLGTPSLFLQLETNVQQSPDPGITSLSATLQDFLLILFERVREAEQLSTPGAREFFELKALDADLRTESQPYAVWKAQAPASGDFGGRAAT